MKNIIVKIIAQIFAVIIVVAIVIGGFWAVLSGTTYISSKLSVPEMPKTTIITRGYCVDNDKGMEMYETVRKIQADMFDSTRCKFTGIRHDMMSCLGDDFYTYICVKN